jgi:hypothetical protein
MLQLTVRGYGDARQQQARLKELIVAWDAAGRPGPDQLRIDAYPSGVPYPDTGGIVPPGAGGIPHRDARDIVSPDAGDIVHVTPHATFVISSSRA